LFKALTEEQESKELLQSQMEEFVQENPKVAQAMHLLGMSLSTYQGAIYAMQGLRLTQSNSTRLEKVQGRSGG